MKKLALLTLSLVFLSFISCTPEEYNLFGTIDGSVIDYETNEPIESVTVKLTPGTRTTTTSSNGRFTFYNLDAGQYSVTAEKIGYETNSKTVNIVENEIVGVVISMRR